MFSKIWEICSLSLAFCLFLSCQSRSNSREIVESADSLLYAEEDTFDIPEKEEDALEEVGSLEHLDVNFDDFMFSFIRSRQLQRERVSRDLFVYDEEGNEVALSRTDLRDAFSFLNGEYYTVLYGNVNQIEEEKNNQSDVIDVERIDLDLFHVTTYTFLQEKGKWMLADLNDNSFAEDELSDFLTFYAHFSVDSVFQAESIAQPLTIRMMDPDDELDARQSKGIEIDFWLFENAAQDAQYVIIDDEYVILDSQLPHFILTNPFDGITDLLADRAISLLNG